MIDQEINKYLEDHYGRTPEGLTYFRLSWTTNLYEHRYSEFHDYHGDIFVRAVREIREVPKYPFAEDRWILERICEVGEEAWKAGLRTDKKYDYREIFIFQDKEGNPLPVDIDKIEQALFFFFKFFLQKSWKERADLRMKILAKRELEKREKNREIIGDASSAAGKVITK